MLAYGLSWWPWPLGDLAARPDTALMVPVGPSVAAVMLVFWLHGRLQLFPERDRPLAWGFAAALWLLAGAVAAFLLRDRLSGPRASAPARDPR